MNWMLVGSVSGFLAVAAGAFGAHGLKGVLAPDRLEIFETAVRYQMYHSLALVLAGSLGAFRAGWAFLLGVVIFSGSLYLLVLTDRRWLGAVTPVGGALFLLGWVLLALNARR
ncbi:MAG: DUF423 domain-containing protein [Candidatus Binatia bacterium]